VLGCADNRRTTPSRHPVSLTEQARNCDHDSSDPCSHGLRGHPGTLQAKKTWISLEPGWQVFDADDGHAIEIVLPGC
jgi:hypothetical protein